MQTVRTRVVRAICRSRRQTETTTRRASEWDLRRRIFFFFFRQIRFRRFSRRLRTEQPSRRASRKTFVANDVTSMYTSEIGIASRRRRVFRTERNRITSLRTNVSPRYWPLSVTTTTRRVCYARYYILHHARLVCGNSSTAVIGRGRRPVRRMKNVSLFSASNTLRSFSGPNTLRSFSNTTEKRGEDSANRIVYAMTWSYVTTRTCHWRTFDASHDSLELSPDGVCYIGFEIRTGLVRYRFFFFFIKDANDAVPTRELLSGL